MAAVSWAQLAAAKAPAAPAQPSAPAPDAADAADLRVVVVDANAIINGVRLEGVADRAVTIQDVLDEVRDKQSRAFLASLPFGIEVREPTDESLAAVKRFARETGDIQALSAVDLRLLALARTLELELHGAGRVREHAAAPRLRPRHRSGPKELPGWGTVANPEDWAPIDEINEREEREAAAALAGAGAGAGEAPPALAAAAASAAGGGASSRVAGAAQALPLDGGASAAGPSGQQHQQQQPRPFVSDDEDDGDAGAGGNDDDGDGWETAKKTRNAARRSKKKALRREEMRQQFEAEWQDDGGGAGGGAAVDGPSANGAEPRPAGGSDAGSGDDGAGGEAGSGSDAGSESDGGSGSGSGSGSDGDEDEGAGDGDDGGTAPAPASRVACMTADFAMQNVLLQMGLRLLARDGRQITRLTRWALRCSACFTVTRESGRIFCPKCGNMALERVEVTTGADGAELFGVRKKHILRGTRYSLPKPRGGRSGKDPVLREDQFLLKAKAFHRKVHKKAPAAGAGGGDGAGGADDDPWAAVTAAEPHEMYKTQQELAGSAANKVVQQLAQPAWKRNPNDRQGAHRTNRRK